MGTVPNDAPTILRDTTSHATRVRLQVAHWVDDLGRCPSRQLDPHVRSEGMALLDAVRIELSALEAAVKAIQDDAHRGS